MKACRNSQSSFLLLPAQNPPGGLRVALVSRKVRAVLYPTGSIVRYNMYRSLGREAVPNSKEQGNVMTESITQPEMDRSNDSGVEMVEMAPRGNRQVSEN